MVPNNAYLNLLQLSKITTFVILVFCVNVCVPYNEHRYRDRSGTQPESFFFRGCYELASFVILKTVQ